MRGSLGKQPHVGTSTHPDSLGFLPQVEIARATLHKSRQLMTKRPLPVPPERELRGISPTSRAGPPVLSVNESTPMHMLVCGTATSGSIPQMSRIKALSLAHRIAAFDINVHVQGNLAHQNTAPLRPYGRICLWPCGSRGGGASDAPAKRLQTPQRNSPVWLASAFEKADLWTCPRYISRSNSNRPNSC